jgi:hypothetical protein
MSSQHNSQSSVNIEITSTQNFLEALWPDPPAGALYLWHPVGEKGGLSTWFPSSALDEMAAKAAQLAEAENVYLGCAMAPRVGRPKQRCKVENVYALPGLWADVDVRGPAHKQDDLPTNGEEAVALANSMPLAPSLFVFSGHGVYPWWLFKEPWILQNDTERQEAIELANRWQALLHAKAAERGWKIDSTADLARVLRLPGTINRKKGLDLAAVVCDVPDTVRRYDPSDQRDALPEPQGQPESNLRTGFAGESARKRSERPLPLVAQYRGLTT